mgnify:CR=1 FL=1
MALYTGNRDGVVKNRPVYGEKQRHWIFGPGYRHEVLQLGRGEVQDHTPSAGNVAIRHVILMLALGITLDCILRACMALQRDMVLE